MAGTSARGSSPHTRGARRTWWLVGAHARDHPRIRGEHLKEYLASLAESGIIPAYAGSTNEWRLTGESIKGSSPHTRGAPCQHSCQSLDAWDHPRIRGEHPASSTLHTTSWGIIPAYAGSTLGSRTRQRRPCWIIPAYAGSTRITEDAPDALRDHPRIRGEHSMTATAKAIAEGSSPHTRGARCSRRVPSRLAGDHPRIRGEHMASSVVSLAHLGSSPHTRGAPVPRRTPPCRVRDHPRIRGEHVMRWIGRRMQEGIIPAYAGSTSRR